MRTRAIKTHSGKRNTGLFYAILTSLPEYKEALKTRVDKSVLREECKQIEVTDFLKAKYGKDKYYSDHLSDLSDDDYAELLEGLEKRASKYLLLEQIQRNAIISNIFSKLTTIGVKVYKGYYTESNQILSSLPIMRGYNLTTVPLDRLPDVFKAVCSYCDNIAAKLVKEAKARAKEVELSKRN